MRANLVASTAFWLAASSTLSFAAAWEVARDKDLITDKTNVVASLRSVITTPDPIGDPVYATFTAGCHREQTVALFNFVVLIGHANRPFTYRIDAQQPKTVTLSSGTDRYYIGFWGREAVDFLKEISKAQKLTVRTKTYGGADADGQFVLAGLPELIVEISTACEWR